MVEEICVVFITVDFLCLVPWESLQDRGIFTFQFLSDMTSFIFCLIHSFISSSFPSMGCSGSKLRSSAQTFLSSAAHSSSS